MNIKLIEPIAITNDELNSLSGKLIDKGHHFTAYDTVETDSDKLIERCKDADIVIIANHPLPNRVIDACENLKFISVAFVGIDHVGKEACLAKGIQVSNAAGYCRDAVAEVALGLTLDCLRNISLCNSVIRDGGTKAGLVGHELHGKTVGIIGTGDIGCAAAALYKAFGCKLLGYSRSERKEALDLGIKYTNLNDLLEQSDIVSVHTPLTEETKGLINAERIALMKKSAILINTSRGPVIDNSALADALNDGKIAAAGIDVFDGEPPLKPDYALLHAKNTICTPHIAFATKESLWRRAQIVFDNIDGWLDGNAPNRVL